MRVPAKVEAPAIVGRELFDRDPRVVSRELLGKVLVRLGAPSAHAFRRGWTVDSLRHGVSQTSVQSAAGWSGPAMVSRYCRQLAGELSMEEFSRRWAV